MATTQDFIDYVREQSGLGAALAARKMFGEYALYLDGKVVALACDGSLFVKPTAASQALQPPLPTAPPYPGGKPHPVADMLLDDADALRALLLATAEALPPPKPKPAAKPKAARKAGPGARVSTRKTPKP